MTTRPIGVQLLIAWLSPLGVTRSDRPNAAPLPFRQVRRIGGGNDGLTDHPLLSVHTIAAGETDANAEGARTHDRLMELIGPWVGPQSITLGGKRFYVDGGELQSDKVIRWADDGTEWASVAVVRLDIRSVF